VGNLNSFSSVTPADTPRHSLFAEVAAWLMSLGVTVALMILILHDYAGIDHWFLAPAFIWGLITGRDVMLWLFGKTDAFDPVALIALLSFSRGFIASLLRLSTNTWLAYVDYPADWRPWVGGIAAINAVGYVVLRISVAGVEYFPGRPVRKIRVFNRRSAPVVLAAFIMLSLLAQLTVFALVGGVSYGDDGVRGVGQLLMLAEPLPILLGFGFVLHHQHRPPPSMLKIFTFLVIIFVVTMLVGGLRGSRSNTIFTMFLAVATIHFTLRSIPRKFLFVSAVAACAFVYAYGFYKKYGADGFMRAAVSASARYEMSHSDRGEGEWYGRVLGGGTNTFTLYRIARRDSDYELAMGETYLGGISRLIPSFIWPNRPPGVIKQGTNVLHGAGTWPTKETSLVWGLGGEAMLNFGPFAAAFAPALIGIMLGGLRRMIRMFPRMDVRRLLIPIAFLCILTINGSNSRSLPFLVFKHSFVVTVCVYLSSFTVSLAQARGDASWQTSKIPPKAHDGSANQGHG